jgi:hypothetical protein
LNPRGAIETVAVSEIGQAGVDGYFAVEGIFVVIPVIAAVGADTAPGAVIGLAKFTPETSVLLPSRNS